jgi:hypothetical protein
MQNNPMFGLVGASGLEDVTNKMSEFNQQVIPRFTDPKFADLLRLLVVDGVVGSSIHVDYLRREFPTVYGALVQTGNQFPAFEFARAVIDYSAQDLPLDTKYTAEPLRNFANLAKESYQ